MSPPNDHTPSSNSSNGEPNVFDQAKEMFQQKKDQATTTAERLQSQFQEKAAETQQAAKEQWDKFNQSEAEKKAAGETTVGESIGSFIDQAKDNTGKVIHDAKTKMEETFSSGGSGDSDKKN